MTKSTFLEDATRIQELYFFRFFVSIEICFSIRMQRAERNAAAADSFRLFTRLFFLAKKRSEIVIEMFNEARQIRHDIRRRNGRKILKMIALTRHVNY